MRFKNKKKQNVLIIEKKILSLPFGLKTEKKVSKLIINIL